MTPSPKALTSEQIRERVQDALRKRAPNTNLESWFWELFAACDVSPETLRPLVCRPDGSTPSMLTFLRLVGVLGSDFADDVLQPLTDVHCSREPDEAAALIADAHEKVAEGLAILAGNVTSIPVKGKIS